MLSLRNGKLLAKKIAGTLKLLAMAAGAVCCACSASPTPPHCYTSATCGDFCDPNVKGSDMWGTNPERSENCPCPCGKDHDRMYPVAYRIRVTVTLKDRVDARPGFSDEPDYFTISPTSFTRDLLVGAIGGSGGTLCGAISLPFTIRGFNSDGTPYIRLSNGQPYVLSGNVDGSFSVSRGVCADGEDPNDLYADGVLYGAQIDGDADSSLALTGGVFGGTTKILAGTLCDGGQATLIAGQSSWVDDPGTIVVSPDCRNCAGAPLPELRLPREKCGYELDLEADVPDGAGGTTRHHIWKMFGDAITGWSGADQYGNTGRVAAVNFNPDDPDYKCCPINDINGCDCIASSCPGCWKAELNTNLPAGDPDQVIKIFSAGSCPSTGTPVEGSTIGVSGGFVEGCPTA